MQTDEILIPEGWTYYAHRTNTQNWTKEDPFAVDTILVKKMMSVVTEREIYTDKMHYGNKRVHAYNIGKGEPFEIRCLICNLEYLRSLDDSNPIKKVMLEEFYFDKRNWAGAAGQRHHSIPKDEELVVLGIGNYDEVYEREGTIIWTIPRRFIPFYEQELLKDNNRVMTLESVEKRR